MHNLYDDKEQEQVSEVVDEILAATELLEKYVHVADVAPIRSGALQAQADKVYSLVDKLEALMYKA